MCDRFLHATLAAIAFVLAGCSSFSSPSKRIAQYRKYPVGRIVYSDVPDAAKLQQLRPYVRVGARPSKRLSSAAGGEAISFTHGVGFGVIVFWSGLQLRVYPDGVVYGIGYTLPAVGFGSDETHWLVTETALHWPRNSKKPSYHLWHQ